jgi:hypothetical protein
MKWPPIAHALLERIEEQCNDKLLCAGDLAENILGLIRATRALVPSAFDPTAVRFEDGLLQWPGGGMNLSLLRLLLARAGLEIVVAGGACASCSDLRGRLRNIYHLTLNYRDVSAAIVAVREASSPGAPAPSADFQITPEALGLVPPGRSNA